ncbi:hypothetical protein EMPS_03767 [Entomortierella parvispora]|uniref:FAD-binding domain-containing protein n=1 Tax=Entomortierella parvispora TaxID=205924 RepID=A0A9P3H803_9FUNG|nr:hypothetical protein EMPS_03767 [Entomortierella parvispora]
MKSVAKKLLSPVPPQLTKITSHSDPFSLSERAAKIKPLGSALALGSTVFYAFEQLGILKDIWDFSIDMKCIELKNEKMEKLATVQMKDEAKIAGYATRLFARHDLHELMVRQIPPEKISMSKKVVRIDEGADGVTIHCADGSSHVGHIVVGADGAYSSIRECMYKKMADQGILPKADSEDLVPGFTGMVGITRPMDPEKYPQLKELDHCHFEVVVAGSSHGCAVWCLPSKQIAWSLSIQFPNVAEAKKQMFENAEWSPEALESMIKEFRDFPCPYNGTIGNLIDETPKDSISKVYLQHKIFQTWHHARSVLLGDACHKLLMAGGQGAINAIQDSIILANCLYDLEDNSQKSITAAFQSYYEQRYKHAKARYDDSVLAAKVFAGATWTDRLVRTVLFNYLPESIQQLQFKAISSYRPQITFLPRVPFQGTGSVLPQLPSKRYQREQEEEMKRSVAA